MQEGKQQEEIQKRLQELEEENRRLRESTSKAPKEKIEVVEGEYKGHPTLSFQGPFRHFSLGLKKLSVIKECWPQIEAFLKKHAQKTAKD